MSMFFKNICVFFSSKSLSLCGSTFSIFGIFLLRREFLSEQGSEEGQLFVGPRLVEMWWQIVVHYNNGVRRPRRYLKISSGFLLCSHTFHLVLALIFIFISEHSFPLRRGHYIIIFPSLVSNKHSVCWKVQCCKPYWRCRCVTPLTPLTPLTAISLVTIK